MNGTESTWQMPGNNTWLHLEANGHVSFVAETASLVTLAALASVSNFLVTLTLYHKPYLLTPSNRFVLSLTLSNLLLCLLVMPFVAATAASGRWLFGLVWCYVTALLHTLINSASLLTVGVIAVDRYYAVLYPMIYPVKITGNRAAFLLGYIWVHALLGSLPPLFGWPGFEFSPSKRVCAPAWHRSIGYTLFWQAWCALPPFVAVLCCYGVILRVARRKARRVSCGVIAEDATGVAVGVVEATVEDRQCDSTSAISKRRQSVPPVLLYSRNPCKALTTIVTVVGAFTLTWAPYLATTAAEALGGQDSVPALAQTVAAWLALGSAACHPLIYGLWNKTVRKELLCMLCCCGPERYRQDSFFHRRRTSRLFSITNCITDLGLSPHLTSLMSSRRLSGQESSSGDTGFSFSQDSGTEVMFLEEGTGDGRFQQLGRVGVPLHAPGHPMGRPQAVQVKADVHKTLDSFASSLAQTIAMDAQLYFLHQATTDTTEGNPRHRHSHCGQDVWPLAPGVPPGFAPARRSSRTSAGLRQRLESIDEGIVNDGLPGEP
uniref:G-protein coupled receptor 161-like n=1 Tax=Myxine glutinosa TaxID=7769 RepID=UPI00358ED940